MARKPHSSPLVMPNPPLPPFNKGGQGGISTHSELPLLLDKGMVDGRPTAYVCHNYVCQLPVTDPEALAAQLAE